MEFTKKNFYKFDDLISIMKLLRSEDGCLWDKEQTHQSIRQNMIEEAYEAVEAIDKMDYSFLCEELGDVLLQVVFHSQMASEKNIFSIDNVSDGICKKLVLRHPHIFGDVKVETSDQVLDNWDNIKKLEKSQKTAADSVNSVPVCLPALMKSQKVQKRAAKTGFDYPSVEMALDGLIDEIAELKEAMAKEDAQCQFDEMGDVLFSAVNVSRLLHIDAEESLDMSCKKFMRRFTTVEQLATEKGIDMKSTNINDLDDLWNQAKLG